RRAGNENFGMAIAIEIASRAELIVSRIEAPASEVRAVGSHHGRGQSRPGFLQDSDAPWAGDKNFGSAITIVIGNGPESVVACIEQPTAETRAVGGHHGRGHRRTGLLQNADTPGTRHDDFGTAVAIHIAYTLREPACGRSNDAVAAIECIVDIAVAIGDHEKSGSGAVGVRRATKTSAPGIAADPRLIAVGIADYQHTMATARFAGGVFKHAAAVAIEVFVDGEAHDHRTEIG